MLGPRQQLKRFSPDRCDALFALVADGRRWFIPADAIEAGCTVTLGAQKYAAYEVQPGQPFLSDAAAQSLSLSAARRGS